MSRKVFNYTHRNKNIEYYVPHNDFDIFIASIDKETGKIFKKSKVIEFTTHHNLVAYQISCSKFSQLFNEPVIVSEDHSLIIYDLESDKIVKIGPRELKKSDKYYLIFSNRSDLLDVSIIKEELEDLKRKYYFLPLLNNLLQQNCVLVSTKHIDVKKLDKKITLYDVTVEPTTTLQLSNGLFIQDSMAQYFVQIKESRQELFTKRITAETIIKYLRDDNWLHRLRHEFQFAIYLLTQPPLVTKAEPLKYKNLREFTYDKKKVYTDPEYIFTPVKFDNDNTVYSLGHVIINKILFPDSEYMIITEQAIDKKKVTKVNEAIFKYIQQSENNLSIDELGRRYLDKLHELIIVITNLITWNKLLTPKITENDYRIYHAIIKELEKLPEEPILGSYKLKQLSRELFETIKHDFDLRHKINMLYLMYISGSRASIDQIEQLILAKGYFADAHNRIITKPVRSNLIRGLTKEEMYISSFGTRKSEIDKMHYTRHSGRAQRMGLIELSIIQFDETVDDCGSNMTFDIDVLNEKHARSLIGRYYYDSNNQLVQITKQNYKELVGKRIRLRSPLFCSLPNFKVCKTCGGYDSLERRKQLGMLAAQNISERLTQLTLRVFHTSGRISISSLLDDLEKFNISFKDSKHLDTSKLTENEILELEKTLNKIAKKINPESTYKVSIDPQTGLISSEGTLYNQDIITTIKHLEKVYLSSSDKIDLHDLYYFILGELHKVSEIKSVLIETLLTPIFIDKNALKEMEDDLHMDISKFVMRYKEQQEGKTSSRQIDYNRYTKIPIRGSDRLYSDILTLIFEPNMKMILSLLTSSRYNNIESAFDRIFQK